MIYKRLLNFFILQQVKIPRFRLVASCVRLSLQDSSSAVRDQAELHLLFGCFDLSDMRVINIYKMLSGNQYFTQPKLATGAAGRDDWIPADQSHPQGI